MDITIIYYLDMDITIMYYLDMVFGYKEGPKTDVSNYRPISLLGSFSKIYEKIMHVRLINFFDSYNLLFDSQYGFRPGRSCEHALLNAHDTLLKSLNNRQVSILLLLDFSKAFDTVDHNIISLN